MKGTQTTKLINSVFQSSTRALSIRGPILYLNFSPPPFFYKCFNEERNNFFTKQNKKNEKFTKKDDLSSKDGYVKKRG